MPRRRAPPVSSWGVHLGSPSRRLRRSRYILDSLSIVPTASGRVKRRLSPFPWCVGPMVPQTKQRCERGGTYD